MKRRRRRRFYKSPKTQVLTFEEREAQRAIVTASREQVRVLLRRNRLSQEDFAGMLRPKRSKSLIDKLERGACRLSPAVHKSITALVTRLNKVEAAS